MGLFIWKINRDVRATSRNRLNKLRSSLDFVVLEELDLHLRYERYWWISIIVIPSIMILSAFDIDSNELEFSVYGSEHIFVFL